jgi:hypothetical protein
VPHAFFAIKDDVVNAGARYEDAEVVVDGNLVTSRKPEICPRSAARPISVLVHAGVPGLNHGRSHFRTRPP